jgi:hypothetical protein
MHTPLKLYSTSCCHLCEQATEILNRLTAYNFSCEQTEICDSEALLAEYGTKIPVLHNCISGQELNWPFTENEVIELITSTKKLKIS